MMTTMTRHSFPTIGEAVKLVFNSTGLLAQKHSQSVILDDEVKKKNIQTKLNRLAKEDGDLDKTLEELEGYLIGLVYEATQDSRVSEALLASARDLYQSYRAILSDEGTYLSKQETIKWLIEYRLADLVIKSVHKYALMHGAAVSRLKVPNEIDWWLPLFTGDHICWPLEKAWRWVYDKCGTSQSRFHNPSDVDGRAKQNLENVSRWFHRNRLPSWGELQSNLEYSVEQMANCSDERYRRELSPEDLHNFRCVLFLSRLSTDVFQQINTAFGRDYVQRLVLQMKAQNRRMVRFNLELKQHISIDLFRTGPLTSQYYYDFWHQEVDTYWRFYAKQSAHNAKLIQPIMVRSNGASLSLSEIKMLRRNLDPFFLSMILRQLRVTPDLKQTSFMQYYMDGGKQRKSSKLSLTDIQDYLRSIDEAGHGDTLQWMVEWMFATYFYRKDDHRSALEHYKKAFELSKHSVGGDTYLLVNQFAECCAKNDKWREFKKLVAWACHQKVEIRWHRGFDESEDAVRRAFEMLKIANYPIL
ncbi:hypothetical protein [Vibrio parahaemolyticus]|uniref:hypothetical protein n=1 Tax=Vibrio parahaemolyticus TaxID=670 RepID=UPI001120830F|nr:hypothetical protein [Vibrio parahaemolyticus]EJG1668941.1 hypothetical protein [Vibrio parahaemolyticus]EJG1776925.1 hypothetical protein [Vibrio parahaemolyticus]TOJ19291.1 hypothetical protein CGI44_19475 [Vibrio parahaemolyticus]TOJ53881.1 hypothetical protein CGI37_18325 [Vibrio parahaemolyticus]